MRIGDVVRRTGVPASTLRFYEEKGLLPPPPRASGRRLFDERTLAQLDVICLARDTGFTLSEIRQLVGEFGRNRWRRLAERKLSQLATAADRLAAMQVLLTELLKCRCPDIEFCGRQLRKAGLSPSRPPGRRPRG
jgi:DNA-binding transcriptional MerR regulator